MEKEKIDVSSVTFTNFKIITTTHGEKIIALQLNNAKNENGNDTYDYLILPKLLEKINIAIK